LKKKNLPSNRPPPPPGQKAAGDNFIKIFWAFEFGGTILLKLIWVSGPRQIDRLSELIYKMVKMEESKKFSRVQTTILFKATNANKMKKMNTYTNIYSH